MSSVAWEWEEQVKVPGIFRHHSGNLPHVLKKKVFYHFFLEKKKIYFQWRGNRMEKLGQRSPGGCPG